MTETEILIVGAGASGLLAARELSAMGKQVIIVEAKERIGGRIFSVIPKGFDSPVEAGAEFIHGDLPVTSSLLKEAGIEKSEMEGETYKIEHGRIVQDERMVEGYDIFINEIEKLKEDMPLAEFLNSRFGDDKYRDMRESVTRLVEGYDAADINRASTFAVKEELEGGGLDKTYRPAEGYTALLNFLADEAKKSGCRIFLNTAVKDIFWKPGRVEVRCENGESFSSRKIIITVSSGVLQCEENKTAFIRFSPELPAKRQAIKQLGFGSVIKIFLLFRNNFWENSGSSYSGAELPNLGFLLNNEPPVRAWWTQLLGKTPIITGWIAGPAALKMQHLPDDIILEETVKHLAGLLGTGESFLKEQLVSGYVYNWGEDPFTCGAYTYATVESEKAADTLREPVDNTIYFAGEAFYKGPSAGTVEAAFSSSMQAVKLI